MQARPATPLWEALAQVVDFRKSRGKRHPLSAVLALAVVAMLSGARSLTAISQWGREHSAEVLGRLGFTHLPGPCVATVHRIFSRMDVGLLERVLSQWWQRYVSGAAGLALDGKTLRGSRAGGADAVQLLAAFAQRAGVALAQQRVEGQDELEAALQLLQQVDLEGWVVSADAGLGRRALAQCVVERGGDYVLIVKQNERALFEDIATLFGESGVVADTLTEHRQTDLHGSRIEERLVQASSALEGYSPWPALKQVVRIQRKLTDKRSGQLTQEVRFAVTSLSSQRADARQLAHLVRSHWGIENRLHWVRDVTLGEDASPVRKGSAPQALASLRNLAIGLARRAGFYCIACATRHYAAHPLNAIKLVTHPLPKGTKPKMK